MVLCLHDDAARETVSLVEGLRGHKPRILDASTAHRVSPGWVYGFAELEPAQRNAVANADRVANPGCYPTGAIALIRPLVDAGLIPADYPISVNAVSGYSGGGRSMIEAYEAGTAPVLRALWPRLRAQARARAAEICRPDPAADLHPLGGQFPAGHAGERAASSRSAARQAEGSGSRGGAAGALQGRRARERGPDASGTARRSSGSSRRRSTTRTGWSSSCSSTTATTTPCWSPASTISAKAPRVLRCRTSSSCWV